MPCILAASLPLASPWDWWRSCWQRWSVRGYTGSQTLPDATLNISKRRALGLVMIPDESATRKLAGKGIDNIDPGIRAPVNGAAPFPGGSSKS